MSERSADEITIRPLEPGDADAVLSVHYAAVHETAAADYGPEIRRSWSPPITPERVDRYHRNAESGEETTVVAVANGSVVGFASIVATSSELRAVYVSPEVGRRGVGGTLLQAVERLAREKGLKELHLDSSLTAERFYTAHGYSSEGRGEHTLRDGMRMICVPMRKAL